MYHKKEASFIGVFGIIVIIAANLLTGCGKGAAGPQGPAGPGYEAPPSTPEETDIAQIVSDENDYRLGLGQTQLSNGLSCTVQALVSGQWLSSASPGYNAGQGVIAAGSNPSYAYLFKSDFNLPDQAGNLANTLLPTNLQALFVNINYVIKCNGQLVVTDTDYYGFALNSDDGSILTIDGAQVINNDGNHGMTLKSGTKFLRRGVHTFSLSYAQTGGGNNGLVLTAGGETIPGMYYYH